MLHSETRGGNVRRAIAASDDLRAPSRDLTVRCSPTSENLPKIPFLEFPPSTGHRSASKALFVIGGKNVRRARFRDGILKLGNSRGAGALASQPRGGTRVGRLAPRGVGAERAGAFFPLPRSAWVCGSLEVQSAGSGSATQCAVTVAGSF